jgi:hypothetical protein
MPYFNPRTVRPVENLRETFHTENAWSLASKEEFESARNFFDTFCKENPAIVRFTRPGVPIGITWFFHEQYCVFILSDMSRFFSRVAETNDQLVFLSIFWKKNSPAFFQVLSLAELPPKLVTIFNRFIIASSSLGQEK